MKRSTSARARAGSRARSAASLEDLPNIGPSIADDLRRIGIRTPPELAGQDPFGLYDALCEATGARHDPCVLDVFISAVRFVEGAPARPWWFYTAERRAALKRRLQAGPRPSRSAQRA